jgi:hypothetical protein
MTQQNSPAMPESYAQQLDDMRNLGDTILRRLEALENQKERLRQEVAAEMLAYLNAFHAVWSKRGETLSKDKLPLHDLVSHSITEIISALELRFCSPQKPKSLMI